MPSRAHGGGHALNTWIRSSRSTVRRMALGMAALDQKLALQRELWRQLDAGQGELWRQLDAGQSDIRDILASEQNGVRRFGESLSQLEDRVEKVELLPEQLANLQGQIKAGGATVRQLSKSVTTLQSVVAGIQTSENVSRRSSVIIDPAMDQRSTTALETAQSALAQVDSIAARLEQLQAGGSVGNDVLEGLLDEIHQFKQDMRGEIGRMNDVMACVRLKLGTVAPASARSREGAPARVARGDPAPAPPEEVQVDCDDILRRVSDVESCVNQLDRVNREASEHRATILTRLSEVEDQVQAVTDDTAERQWLGLHKELSTQVLALQQQFGEQVAALQAKSAEVQELKHEVQGVRHDLQKYDQNVDDRIRQLDRQAREASWVQNQGADRYQRDDLRPPTQNQDADRYQRDDLRP